jgi:hypothetical protein
MKKYLLVLVSIILITACNNKKKVVQEPEIVKPTWINERPITDVYYIGIGSASKVDGTNFIESAKNNALNDLASEIKVNLESSTVYYQNETNKTFNEDFRSTIKTSIEADLEGYTMIDSWQDQNKYWVYYRLSKSEYFAQIERKKMAAKKAGEEFYKLGNDAANNGDVLLAITNYFDAMSAIKEFSPGSIEVVSEGKMVFMDQLIMASLQNLISSIEIDNNDVPEPLSYFNGFKTYYPLKIKRGSKELAGIPLESVFFNQYGEVSEQYVSNENATVSVSMAANDLKLTYITKLVRLNLNEISKNRVDAEFLKFKVANLVLPRVELKVAVIKPTLFLSSSEKEFGKKRTADQLSGMLISGLVKEGIQIVDKKEKADLILELDADTKFQSKDDNFTVVVLNYSINLTEVKTRKSVYSITDGPIKGVNLDESRASVKAYEKAEGEINRKVISKLKEVIL